MAVASTPTLLSLDRYAEIMGIGPMHFNGAQAWVSGQEVMKYTAKCEDIWRQYAWQNADQVGRDELAMSIRDAEIDVAKVLGYWPAPTWMYGEIHKYPRHYRRDAYNMDMYNVRGQHKTIKLNYGKFIQGGVRTTSLISTATVAGLTLDYSDEDGDGFEETATVTATTTLTDECEIHVYFTGMSAAPEWEIRPARTKSISGGIFTATFWSWQFIDPDLWNAFPLDGETDTINISTDANFVTSVDVYRVYNDYTSAHVTIQWENTPTSLYPSCICNICGGTGCIACAFTTQDGCVHVRDTEVSMVAVVPADYDSTDGRWEKATMSVCRDPDQILVNYYAGEQSNRYLSGFTCNPMPLELERAIAWLATARLERPYCACGASTALGEDLRTDLALSGAGMPNRFLPESLLDNPWGTRLGEVRAWQRISRLLDSTTLGVAL